MADFRSHLPVSRCELDAKLKKELREVFPVNFNNELIERNFARRTNVPATSQQAQNCEPDVKQNQNASAATEPFVNPYNMPVDFALDAKEFPKLSGKGKAQKRYPRR